MAWLGQDGLQGRYAHIAPSNANRRLVAGVASGIKRISNERHGASMSKVCEVTGKRPMSGNNVSHAHNKTRRRFAPNLHDHRFWVASQNRFVRLRVSAAGMRIIDKKGIDAVLADIEKRRSRGR